MDRPLDGVERTHVDAAWRLTGTDRDALTRAQHLLARRVAGPHPSLGNHHTTFASMRGHGELSPLDQRVDHRRDHFHTFFEAADEMRDPLAQAERGIARFGRRRNLQGGELVEACQHVACEHHRGTPLSAHGDHVTRAQRPPHRNGVPRALPADAEVNLPLQRDDTGHRIGTGFRCREGRREEHAGKRAGKRSQTPREI